MQYPNLFYLITLGVILGIIILISFGLIIYGIVSYARKGLPKRDGFRYGAWLAFDVFWIGSGFFVWMASAFKKVHWALAWVLITIIWETGFLHITRRSPEYKNDKFKNRLDNYFRSLLHGAKRFGSRNSVLVLVSFIIISFIISFFTYNVCVGIHPFRVSSRYSRRIQGSSCTPGQVCNFILTVPEDLSNSIIANWHSQDEPIQSFALFGTTSHKNYFNGSLSMQADQFNNPYSSESNATFFKMTNFEDEENRWVSWADITGLAPSTVYYIVVAVETKGNKMIFYPERKFRTAPNDGTPYTFITGGDMGMTTSGEDLSINAALAEPLFVMLGGDVAYDSGFVSCYRCWDEWFKRWDDTFITPLGFTLPIITTIGNHEAGSWNSKRNDVQFYNRYLPFQLGLQNIDPQDRLLQHYHYIGNNTIIVVMDSSVVDKIEDQVEWLDTVLSQNNQRLFKFGLYHIALYPCTRIGMDVDITDQAAKSWGPVFDKYHLTVGYENHYHLYKRSKQLVDGVENINGTLYIGDGAFGVLASYLKVKDYDYLVKSGRIEHIIKTKVEPNNNQIYLETINTHNEVFDSWNRTLL
ncbi:hypothetical protein DICPUDRAFT_147519 [Dictyostelium purpureum]|uniref:Purple acid phosphatase N-terminal domain-containing protein n=1 Tax=Dictyostelium purpureum TaxID=5786 RepID=F0Z8P6_DICPU|nr:uncharacterized protein DICPUDRAFT_147519 [Dictyostelium purpureum]EGC39693.1 hypothetical protein DICPUDRAFT_147519 [Dictyostelium purpureum]|eukprot:XP_003283802.1 hypothetical protein DICPUDRAFT_147519 [Dictyostelium purpureum]